MLMWNEYLMKMGLSRAFLFLTLFFAASLLRVSPARHLDNPHSTDMKEPEGYSCDGRGGYEGHGPYHLLKKLGPVGSAGHGGHGPHPPPVEGESNILHHHGGHGPHHPPEKVKPNGYLGDSGHKGHGPHHPMKEAGLDATFSHHNGHGPHHSPMGTESIGYDHGHEGRDRHYPPEKVELDIFPHSHGHGPHHPPEKVDPEGGHGGRRHPPGNEN